MSLQTTTLLCVTLLFASTQALAVADGKGRPSAAPSYHQQVNDHYPWVYRLFWAVRGHQHSGKCGHDDNARQLAALAKVKEAKARLGHGKAEAPASVPELHGAGAPLALALLAGLVLLRRETRRRSPTA